ncbi:MAG: hypothetical protein C0615_00515 [Desulfuromonas sp.]|nr:MAG: hypothetical protein C0615_00515 [Desulfuromonas sp.]
MRRIFLSLLIVIALLVGCDAGEGPHVSSRALVSPANNSTLNIYSPIKITFNSDMDTSTLLLGGSLFSESDGGVWSATRYVNDTLTIRPSTSWSGGNHTLTVDVKNFYDMPIESLDLSYTVDPTLNAGALVINEVDYRDRGTDDLEFVEIFNVGTTAQALAGINLVLVDGATSTVYNTIDLSDGGAITSLAPGGYLVVAGNAGSLDIGAGAQVINLTKSDMISNANAGVALHDTNTDELLDALSYGGSITSVVIGITSFNLVEGTPLAVVDDEEDFAFNKTSANPSGFVDISATGLDLSMPDDGEVDFTSSVTNGLGDWSIARVGDNGAIYNAATGDVPLDNDSLPSAGFPAAAVVLMPFWDDMDCFSGNVFAEELPVKSVNTLVVQWENCPHYSSTGGIGSATFQAQIFSAGPILARYAYRDVDFGNATYDNGASATIGLQTDTASPPGSFGLYSYNSATVFANDTIDVLSGKSLSRYPNGLDTNNAAVDFVVSGATPGSANL